MKDFVSTTRRGIWEGFQKVVVRLNEAKVTGEIWIDGSFVTEKIDPSDIDYLLCVQADLYDGDAGKRAVINWASSPEIYESHSCDAYRLVEYNRKHPLFRVSDAERGSWQDTFGKSLRGVQKGMALLKLPAVIE